MAMFRCGGGSGVSESFSITTRLVAWCDLYSGYQGNTTIRTGTSNVNNLPSMFTIVVPFDCKSIEAELVSTTGTSNYLTPSVASGIEVKKGETYTLKCAQYKNGSNGGNSMQSTVRITFYKK